MIPARNIVTVNPGTIDGGGNPLSLNGVVLTMNDLLPPSAPMSFSSANAVGTFFGASSAEKDAATVYFKGYDNSTVKPGIIWFSRYVHVGESDGSVVGIRSGSFAGYTLTQIQDLTPGTMTISGTDDAGDLYSFTSASINLSGATSFSNAASIITTAFNNNIVVTWNAEVSAFILVIDTFEGAPYTINYATGAFSPLIKMAEESGALLTQGVDNDTPETAMDRVYSGTQNWVSFTTMFEPVIEDKTLFAEWTDAQDQRFLYVPWDTDAQAIVNGSTTCFGYLAKQAEYNAVMPVYDTLNLALFVLGAGASIDFSRNNARITFAFKHQSGMADTVTDEQIAANLLENGYSYYGIYATANDDFSFLYNGQVSGQWLWADTFLNQVYLNNQFQLALMDLLTQITSIPYNQEGYNLIRSVMQDPINQFINFGGIRAGVVLSESQKAQVNNAAGLDVASIIETQGYYLQILDPGAQVRAARGTPIINFWYTDGGAVQQITVASIDVM